MMAVLRVSVLLLDPIVPAEAESNSADCSSWWILRGPGLGMAFSQGLAPSWDQAAGR